MRKWLPYAFGGFIVILLVAVTFLQTRLRDEKRIGQLESEKAVLKALGDSIRSANRERDLLNQQLFQRIDALTNTAHQLRTDVANIERGRRADQLTIRMIDSQDATQRAFVHAFPEVEGSFLRTSVPRGPRGLQVEYGMVPLHALEGFVLFRQNMESYRAQRDSLWRLDMLNKSIIAKHDTVYRNERASRLVLETLVDTSMRSYFRVTDEYIRRLREPRFQLKVPSGWVLAGTAAAGLWLGTQVPE